MPFAAKTRVYPSQLVPFGHAILGSHEAVASPRPLRVAANKKPNARQASLVAAFLDRPKLL